MAGLGGAVKKEVEGRIDEISTEENNDNMEDTDVSEDDSSSDDYRHVRVRKKSRRESISCTKAKSRKTGKVPKKPVRSPPTSRSLPNISLKVIPMQVVKRQALTLKEKLDIIERLKSGENQTKVAVSLKLGHATINRIWSAREKIEQDALKGNLSKKKCRPLQNAELEGLLVSWVEYMKEQGTPANGTQIKEQAKILAKGLGNEDFSASAGWLDKFKKRTKIILPRARKHCRMLKEIKEKEELREKFGQQEYDDDDHDYWGDADVSFNNNAVDPTGNDDHQSLVSTVSKSASGFSSTIKKTLANKKASSEWISRTWSRLSEGYEPENIFYVNECGLFYRTTPENFKDVQGLSCRNGEYPEERLSILFGVNALGTERLKLVVVGGSPSPSSFGDSWSPQQDQEKLPTEYWFHPKAFVTPDIISSWLSRWNSQMETGGRNILLIMSDSRAHQTVQSLCSTLSCIKIVLPSGLGASVLRYLDTDVGAELKLIYRKLMLDKLIRQMGCQSEKIRISLLDACRILHIAWMGLDQRLIGNLFRKSGLLQTPLEEVPLDKKKLEDRAAFKTLIAEARIMGIEFPKQLSLQGFVDLDVKLIAVDMSVGILDERTNRTVGDERSCSTPPPTRDLLNNLDHLSNWAVANHTGDISSLHDAISTIHNFCAKNLIFCEQAISSLSHHPSKKTASQSNQQPHTHTQQNSSQLQNALIPNTSSAPNAPSTVDFRTINNTTHHNSFDALPNQIAFPFAVNSPNLSNQSQQINYSFSNGQASSINLQEFTAAATLLQQHQLQIHPQDHNSQNQYCPRSSQRN